MRWSAPCRTSRHGTSNDGQTFANIGHTLPSKGVVQTVVIFSAVIGLASYVTPANEPGYGVWPRGWPMAIQVVMAIVVAEFGLYWAHRIAHEWKPLWRFHAVHHSVIRLWIVNTGRFHFVDSFKSIVVGMAILLALGAPMEVLIWLSAVTAFIGMLTHCNVDMRFGPLSWWFNTPELHRWHHSRDLREGNKNYSENIMLWDHMFGTFSTRATIARRRISASANRCRRAFCSSWPGRSRHRPPTSRTRASAVNPPIESSFGIATGKIYSPGLSPTIVQRRITRMYFASSNPVARCSVQRLSHTMHSRGAQMCE